MGIALAVMAVHLIDLRSDVLCFILFCTHTFVILNCLIVPPPPPPPIFVVDMDSE